MAEIILPFHIISWLFTNICMMCKLQLTECWGIHSRNMKELFGLNKLLLFSLHYVNSLVWEFAGKNLNREMYDNVRYNCISKC